MTEKTEKKWFARNRKKKMYTYGMTKEVRFHPYFSTKDLFGALVWIPLIKKCWQKNRSREGKKVGRKGIKKQEGKTKEDRKKGKKEKGKPSSHSRSKG